MRFFAEILLFMLSLSSNFALKCDCNNTNSGAYAAQYQTTINLITQLTNRQIAPIQCSFSNVCEVNDSILLSKAGFHPTCLKMTSTVKGGTEFKHCTYWKAQECQTKGNGAILCFCWDRDHCNRAAAGQWSMVRWAPTATVWLSPLAFLCLRNLIFS